MCKTLFSGVLDISLKAHSNPMSRYYDTPILQTATLKQTSSVTCPRSQGCQEADPRFKPGYLGPPPTCSHSSLLLKFPPHSSFLPSFPSPTAMLGSFFPEGAALDKTHFRVAF